MLFVFVFDNFIYVSSSCLSACVAEPRRGEAGQQVISAHFGLSFCMVIWELWVVMGSHCVWIHMLLFPPGSWRDSLGIPKTARASLIPPIPPLSIATKASIAILREQATEESLSQVCFGHADRCSVNTHQELRPTREPWLLHWPIFSKKTSRWTMHSFQALSYVLHLALSPSPARLMA